MRKTWGPESDFHIVKATKKTTTNGAKASDAAKSDDAKKTEVRVEIKKEKPDVTGARARLASQHRSVLAHYCLLPLQTRGKRRRR